MNNYLKNNIYILYRMDKEQRKIYNAKYYNKNKEKIIEKGKVRIICEKCNSGYSKFNKKNHEKSDKHKQNEKIFELTNRLLI